MVIEFSLYITAAISTPIRTQITETVRIGSYRTNSYDGRVQPLADTLRVLRAETRRLSSGSDTQVIAVMTGRCHP